MEMLTVNFVVTSNSGICWSDKLDLVGVAGLVVVGFCTKQKQTNKKEETHAGDIEVDYNTI